MKKNAYLLCFLLIAFYSNAMLQTIKSDEPALARCEDTVPKFFVHKNLFAALMVKASQRANKEPFEQLCNRIKGNNINTNTDYIFTTAADIHRRLLLDSSIKHINEKIASKPEYSIPINNIPMHIAIRETQLPSGYEYMAAVIDKAQTDRAWEKLEKKESATSSSNSQGNDTILDEKAFSFPAQWEKVDLKPKNADTQPFFTSMLLCERHSNIYELYSEDLVVLNSETTLTEFAALIKEKINT